MADELTIEQQRALALARARRRRKEKAQGQPQDGESQGYTSGVVDAFTNGLTFGLGPKITALEAAALGRQNGGFFDYEGSFGDRYEHALGQERQQNEQFRKENPVSSYAGEIAGGLVSGMGAAGVGGRMAMQAAPRVAGNFAAKMAGDAALGAGIGATQAYGNDENIGAGALLGGVLGAVSRPIIAAGSQVVKTGAGMLGIGNRSRANEAIAEIVRRSGRTADDLVDDVGRAAADGQPEYVLADALGSPGQRMLGAIHRSPGDARTRIADTLVRRQAGQGDRLSNAIVEGFNAPKTAMQTRTLLEGGRKRMADAAYGAARQNAGPVDLTGAIQAIDDIIRPGVNQLPSAGDDIAENSIRSVLNRIRLRMTDGKTNLTDFSEIQLLRGDIGDAIETALRKGEKFKAGKLKEVQRTLDDAMESASSGYKQANRNYSEASRIIDSIDEGKGLVSGRMRSTDALDRYNAMTPAQQAASRVGAADEILGRLQRKDAGPMTNRARMFTSSNVQEQFPRMAAPGRGQQLMDRLGREQRMFETSSTAMGGSRTADNLGDIAEMQTFDPSILGAVVRRRFGDAAIQGLTKSINALQGRNQATRDMIADVLLQGSPTRVRADLAEAFRTGQRLTERQSRMVAALLAGGLTTGSIASR